MEKEVELLVVGIIGAVALLTVVSKQSDLAQVCVAGLIGFLGAKATGKPFTNPDMGYKPTTKEEVKEIMEEVKKTDEMNEMA